MSNAKKIRARSSKRGASLVEYLVTIVVVSLGCVGAFRALHANIDMKANEASVKVGMITSEGVSAAP